MFKYAKHLAALALTALLCLPMAAYAETEKTIGNYDDDGYKVTIPAEVSLPEYDGSDNEVSETLTVSAELDKYRTLDITIASANSWQLCYTDEYGNKSANADTPKLSYELTGTGLDWDENDATKKALQFKTKADAETNLSANLNVKLTKPEAATMSGSYQDKLVFEISSTHKDVYLNLNELFIDQDKDGNPVYYKRMALHHGTVDIKVMYGADTVYNALSATDISSPFKYGAKVQFSNVQSLEEYECIGYFWNKKVDNESWGDTLVDDKYSMLITNPDYIGYITENTKEIPVDNVIEATLKGYTDYTSMDTQLQTLYLVFKKSANTTAEDTASIDDGTTIIDTVTDSDSKTDIADDDTTIIDDEILPDTTDKTTGAKDTVEDTDVKEPEPAEDEDTTETVDTADTVDDPTEDTDEASTDLWEEPDDLDAELYADLWESA